MAKKPEDIINELIAQYQSVKKFARAISEDSADVIRWRYGRNKITARSVIKICKLHPDIQPYELNPDHFPNDLKFIFKEKK